MTTFPFLNLKSDRKYAGVSVGETRGSGVTCIAWTLCGDHSPCAFSRVQIPVGKMSASDSPSPAAVSGACCFTMTYHGGPTPGFAFIIFLFLYVGAKPHLSLLDVNCELSSWGAPPAPSEVEGREACHQSILIQFISL